MIGGMAAICLDTFASLLEHEHGLAAYCPKCQRWATVNLHKLVASGQGQQTFIGRKPRCRVCGSTGHWQVRSEYKPYKAPDLPKIGACRASAGRPSLPFSPPAPERPTSLPQ